MTANHQVPEPDPGRTASEDPHEMRDLLDQARADTLGMDVADLEAVVHRLRLSANAPREGTSREPIPLGQVLQPDTRRRGPER